MKRLSAILTLTVLPAVLLVAGPSRATAEEGCASCEEHQQAGPQFMTVGAPAPGSPVPGNPGAGGAQMPAGHPPIGGSGEMPQGHPPMGGTGQMPPGHPPMGGESQTPFQGTVAVRVVQGSKEGRPVAGAALKLELLRGGSVDQTLEVKVDDHGVAMFENLDLIGQVQPVATVEHEGVSYRQAGQLLSAATPDQMMRVTLYDATHQAPALTVGMRHVMLKPVPGGMSVTEVISLTNPADRTYLGVKPAAEAEAASPQADEHGKAETFSLPIPAAATQVEFLSYFDSCCTRVEAGRIISTAPLHPGTVEVCYRYLLVPQDGQVALPILSELPVKHMMVFIPDDGSEVRATGMAEGERMQAGSLPLRVFRQMEVAAGQTATLTVKMAHPSAAGPAAGGAQAAEGPQAPRGNSTAKAVAGVGAGVLVAGAVVLLLKAPRRRTAD